MQRIIEIIDFIIDTVYCQGKVAQSSRRSKGGEIVVLEFKVMDSQAGLLWMVGLR